MAEIKWTKAQLKAIESSGKSVIVSAAAGSGKTAVLVERIIRKICSEENPARVDKLLVVTFTKAAANEMRERLSQAIDEKLKENPRNRFLLRQKAMLPMAEICNMDQYFNALVRDNFHTLGITPDFRILDDSERKLLENESIDESIEFYYDEGGEDFENLLETLGCAKDDKKLSELISEISHYSEAFIDPDKWLCEVPLSYSEEALPQDTVFGRVILDAVKAKAEYISQLLEKAIEYTKDLPALEKVYCLVSNEKATADRIVSLCEKKDWDGLFNEVHSIKYATFPSGTKEAKALPERGYAKLLRDRAKEINVKYLAKLVCADTEEFKEDARKLYPLIKKLIDIVLLYRQKYTEKKAEINAYDFSDILHLTIRLLIKDGEPTPMAYELRKKYDEIFIDEYQDTNEAQDAVFRALSDDEKNLFLVGDIKQSIYRFRLAMPQVFLNKMLLWRREDYTKAEYVNLDCNYRSRKAVLDTVNYVFKRSMTEQVGEIDYNDEQALKYGSKYPTEDGVQTELYMLDRGSLPEDYTEARFIADKIEYILKHEQVFDKKIEKMRPAQKKDICVIFRRNSPGIELAKQLREREIPSFLEASVGFFENREIQTVVSLLSVIDNPLQDVHLLNVLLSPLFGFSTDEVAMLRINKRKGRLYDALLESEDEKAKAFIAKLNQYRRLSTALSVKALLRTIYEDTGYLYIAGSENAGELKRLNLLMLLEYADSFESNFSQGLPGFMRYIRRCSENSSEPSSASGLSDSSDVVRIMTIHKSKGLEFPIVILGNLDYGDMNDSYSDLKIHEDVGIGLKVCDKKHFKKYSTIQYEAAKEKSDISNTSEALRILYVAMTRAKEKLILCASASNPQNTIEAVAHCALLDKLSPVEVLHTSTFLQLVLKSFISHKDFGEFRSASKTPVPFKGDSGVSVKAEIITEIPEFARTNSEENVRERKVDNELLKELRERAEYVYPYMDLSMLPTKKAASSFNESFYSEKFFASVKPDFASKGGLSAAGRGTATHRFMELCSFEEAARDVEAEIKRLADLGKLSEEQTRVLDRKSISQFFKSDLYRRIEKADNVYREMQFTVFVPLSLLDREKGEKFPEEKILVQGVIDLAFEENGKITVADYKTDRVSDAGTLAQMYANQLLIYKIAAEECLKKQVSELLLYSFNLSEEIKIQSSFK